MTYDELLQKHQMREAYIAKQDDIISNICQQLEVLRKGWDYAEKANRVLKNQNADMYQKLQDERKLSEERRVALEKCEPMIEECYHEKFGWQEDCVFCGDNIHKPDCDYVRLIKQD